jgi:hypothetical protein
VDLLVRIAQPMRSTIVAALLFGIAAAAQNSPRQNEQTRQKEAKARFLASLPPGFQVPPESDAIATRLFAYYGAVFVARGGAVPPPTLEFADQDEVAKWQATLKTDKVTIGNTEIELQSVALAAFLEARVEAQKIKLDITPRGTDPAKRGYLETVKWWKSRVDSGLAHWVAAKRLRATEASRIRGLSPVAQIPEILRLEHRGLYFSEDFSRTILSSVAPPGMSQHISMLALDINEHDNYLVRVILAKHGWYQTVLMDTPHFTYLGVSENDLPGLGLFKFDFPGAEYADYWVPDLGIPFEKLLEVRGRTVDESGNRSQLQPQISPTVKPSGNGSSASNTY